MIYFACNKFFFVVLSRRGRKLLLEPTSDVALEQDAAEELEQVLTEVLE
jgi:hypothetical protein